MTTPASRWRLGWIVLLGLALSMAGCTSQPQAGPEKSPSENPSAPPQTRGHVPRGCADVAQGRATRIRGPGAPSRGRLALGPGPVYAVAGSEGYTIDFGFDPDTTSPDQPNSGGPWYAAKVGWLFTGASASARGVRVRVVALGSNGHALIDRDDGHGGTTWGREKFVRSGWPRSGGFAPSTTLVDKAGCYQWQIRGVGVKENIFFRARLYND
jgi:hypothetical protein